MLKSFRNSLLYSRKFPSCKINNDLIVVGPIDNLVLGNGVEIQHRVFLHLGGLEWCDFQGQIKIGDNSILSPGTMIYGCGIGGVEIGNNFKCGPGIKIFSSYEDYTNKFHHSFKKVIIKNNVMLYTNVVVHHGVTIGENAVIGANSVVLSDIPDNVFAAGNPAKVKKTLR